MRKTKNISLFLSLILVLIYAGSIYCQASKQVYFNNKNNQMKIALTFDDGPHPRYTPQILDILDKYGIKATFFVIGQNARDYPSALIETEKRGHQIANHTYSHITLSSSNLYMLEGEIERCEAEIFNVTEYRTKLFRPPEGMICSEMTNMADNMDYTVILWNLDTRDWAHTPPDQIAQNVISNIKAGDVILMHDFIGRNSPTPKALELFIPVLLEKGYNFVTVSELIGTK